MRTRRFGRSGREVGVIGQGTFNLEKGNRKAAIAALRTGIELGMNHIDTAEMYGSGRSERFLAHALSGVRGQVFLASKVLPENASYDGTIAACEASLRRLQTDRLDCYILHWHEDDHPLEETFRAFEKLEKDGKILSWGVSNFELPALRAAVELAGPGRISCNQVEYNLRKREAEGELLSYCLEQDIALVGYSPFSGARPPSRWSLRQRGLRKTCEAAGVSLPIAALAYLLRKDGTFAIPKASKASHVRDNARASDLELSDALVRTLESIT